MRDWPEKLFTVMAVCFGIAVVWIFYAVIQDGSGRAAYFERNHCYLSGYQQGTGYKLYRCDDDAREVRYDDLPSWQGGAYGNN